MMKELQNMLPENLIMVIDAKQYLTDISFDELVHRNVVLCTDGEHRKTLLIRNSQVTTESATFENKFFIMKNNVVLVAENSKIGDFHILICKNKDDISVQHFCRVCEYLFIKNNDKLSTDEMLKLFYSLERIFSQKASKNTDLEIGLYGELAVINYLYHMNCRAFNMWHADFFNKHDFELSKKVKVEVKTTVKDFRKHSFGHDQVYRTSLKVYIISCIVNVCEKGMSLYELCKNTLNILSDASQMLAIELLVAKLGLDEEYQGVNCVLEEVFNDIKLYDADSIPHLTQKIPDGVSNIHYDIDLSNIQDCDFKILNEVEY